MTVDDGISSMQCGFVSEIVSSARRGSDLRVVIASSYCFRRLLPIGKYFVYMHQLLLGSNLAAVATPLVMLLCSMNCRNSNCLAAIRFCHGWKLPLLVELRPTRPRRCRGGPSDRCCPAWEPSWMQCRKRTLYSCRIVSWCRVLTRNRLLVQKRLSMTTSRRSDAPLGNRSDVPPGTQPTVRVDLLRYVIVADLARRSD